MVQTARRGVAELITLISLIIPAGIKGADGGASKDLAQSSLEELMNIEVSSVSRREQPLSQVAAAVFVITQDDIRRSGARCIPEALRLAPGVEVAQIDASKWAISARGFNGRFANKMLVLIDGRSVYTNLYSGVYWDQNDVLLEDVERIEVIRGPGATMWGANAVNGVINVITKSAKATEGVLVTAGAGTDDLAYGAVRYGGRAGQNLHYRIYVKSSLTNDSPTATGANAGDRWTERRGGARIDWDASARDSVTFHGDVYHGGAGETFVTNFPLYQFGSTVRDYVHFGGGYGLARWAHRTANGSEFALQAYFNQENRNEGQGLGRFRTVDFDFQDRLHAGRWNDFTWGLGYRRMSDMIDGKIASFDPASRGDNLYSSFLQDDIAIVENRLTLTVGSKFQHNAYSGFEYQPSGRLLWAPNAQNSFWTAVSRAVRTPARRDADLRLYFEIPQADGSSMTGLVEGNKEFRAEVEQAYEAGFRTQAARRLSLDIAGFYNQYHRLQNMDAAAPYADFSSGQPQVIIPFIFVNNGDAHTYGMETAVTWTATSNWKLSGSHSWLEYRETPAPGAGMGNFPNDNSPQHQFNVHSAVDLTHRLSFDVMAYYVGALTQLQVPAYTRLDAHLNFKVTRDLDLSVGGRNLLDTRHQEFRPEDQVLNEWIRRSVWMRLTWAF
jgi:iron complex outermembrane receptor protein